MFLVIINKYFKGESTLLNDLLKQKNVGMSSTMTEDEQKKYIKEQVKQTLPTIKTVEELKDKLWEKGLSLWVRKNDSGEIKGFSFKVKFCNNAVPIKARDVSLNFDKELFRGVQALHSVREIESFEGFISGKSKVEHVNYIVSNNQAIPQQPAEFSVVSGGAGDLQNDNSLLSKKKKKKKNDMDFGR